VATDDGGAAFTAYRDLDDVLRQVSPTRRNRRTRSGARWSSTVPKHTSWSWPPPVGPRRPRCARRVPADGNRTRPRAGGTWILSR